MNSPVVFFNISWMKEYKGINKNDLPVNGGKNPRMTKQANEAWNYFSRNSHCYGHVETSKKEFDRKININTIGASEEDEFIKGVTIVWIATPRTGGREVIGWWKNATVWRERQSRDNFKSDNQYGKSYIAKANAKDCILLDVIERDQYPFKFPMHARKGWPGQTPWFYPKDSKSSSFREYFKELQNEIEKIKSTRNKSRKVKEKSKSSKGFGKSTFLHRQLVEKFAIEKTRIYIGTKYNGFLEFLDVSLENKGWDVEFVLDTKGSTLNVEVKGLTGKEPNIILTPNEYNAFKSKSSNYRLVIVTRCLTKSFSVHIIYYDRKDWRIENIGGKNESLKNVIKISEIYSARIQAM